MGGVGAAACLARDGVSISGREVGGGGKIASDAGGEALASDAENVVWFHCFDECLGHCFHGNGGDGLRGGRGLWVPLLEWVYAGFIDLGDVSTGAIWVAEVGVIDWEREVLPGGITGNHS